MINSIRCPPDAHFFIHPPLSGKQHSLYLSCVRLLASNVLVTMDDTTTDATASSTSPAMAAINSSADSATAASSTPERNTQQQRALSHIHVHLNTPQGVRGLNIPLPPGTMLRTTPQGGGVNGNASPAGAATNNTTTAAQGRHGIRITAVNGN